MKVKCVHTSYREVVPSLNQFYYPHQSILHLIRGKEYGVFGIVKTKESKKIEYLIVDETNLPDLYLSELFEITDSKLPILDWHFMTGNRDRYHSAIALIGYDEFVNNREHFENIILHEDDVKARFHKWRERICSQYLKPEDEWETVNTDIEGVEVKFIRNRKTGELKSFQFIF